MKSLTPTELERLVIQWAHQINNDSHLDITDVLLHEAKKLRVKFLRDGWLYEDGDLI